MKTIAIINQKGGCGKTTTAINLAGCFAAAGWRTLLADMDPQSHCAAGLAIPEQRIDLTIGDAMLAAEDATSGAKGTWIDTSRLLWRVSRNLDLAPSTLKLAGLEAARGELAGKPDAERRLARALARLNDSGPGYDICFIDCSPAFGLLAYNSLAAADEIIIPVETGFFSLQGSAKQLNTIKSLAKRLGVTPNHRVLATMHDPTSVLAKDLLEELHRRFPGKVIPTVIRFDQSLREAASFGQPVGEYAPESVGAQDYEALALWLMEQGLGKPSAEPTRVLRGRIAAPPTPAPPSSPVAAPPPAPVSAEPASPVQVVPGVADRTLTAAWTAAPAAGLSGPGGAAPAVQPAPATPTSRAHDLAERAKKLQQRPPRETGSTIAIAEPPATVGRESPAAQAAAPATQPRTEEPAWTPPAPPAAQPFRSLGVSQTAEGVWFVQPASMGRSLSVAGDFNGWSAEAAPLRLNRELGVFEGCLPLRPGIAQYRVVVDGRWIADPYNPLMTTNPYGEANSVVVVRDLRPPAPPTQSPQPPTGPIGA